MQSQIRLGRITGVEVGLHYSWLIIAFLITLSLGGHFRSQHPSWGAVVIWLTAGLTAALFFGTLLLHELSHAWVARARGLPVGEIMLFVSRTYVIAVRHGAASELTGVRRHLEAHPELLEPGPAAAIWAIVDKVVDDYQPVVEGIENDIEETAMTLVKDRRLA